MSEAVEEVKMILSDATKNSNKFWHGRAFDNGELVVEWGRVGYGSQSKTHRCGSIEAAKRKLASLKRNKEKKGYAEQRTVGAARVETAQSGDLASIAIDQIEGNHPETARLLKYLAQKNRHNILAKTTLTYDDQTGLFSTPLGIVTPDAIQEARDHLTIIGDVLAKNKHPHQSKKLIASANEYFKLIPTRIPLGPRGFDLETLLGSQKDVHKQNDILDSLEAAYTDFSKRAEGAQQQQTKKASKLFAARVDLCEEDSIIDQINQLFQKGRKSMHASHRLSLRKVFHMTIDSMTDAFNDDGVHLDNQMQLWHGTRAHNLLSIIRGGFVIPPANAAHCTGRMYGNGVYFSDQSTKSLNYAYGYWDGGRYDNTCYMILSAVAMGKMYRPTNYYDRRSLPRKGYDSTFAEGGRGVMNNEMIVYRTSQILPQFLVEFGE